MLKGISIVKDYILLGKHLPEEYITKLFTTQYAGLRAIGTDVIKEEDRERYEKIRKMVENVKEI